MESTGAAREMTPLEKLRNDAPQAEAAYPVNSALQPPTATPLMGRLARIEDDFRDYRAKSIAAITELVQRVEHLEKLLHG